MLLTSGCAGRRPIKVTSPPSTSTVQSQPSPADRSPLVLLPNTANSIEHAAPVKAPEPISASPPSPAPLPSALCSISFDRDKARPVRIDDKATACLDEIALSLQRYPDAKVALVGNEDAKEMNSKKFDKSAAERAINAKDYLVVEKGIDGSRIHVFTGIADAKMVTTILIPSGAELNSTGATPVDESIFHKVEKKVKKVAHHHHNRGSVGADFDYTFTTVGPIENLLPSGGCGSSGSNTCGAPAWSTEYKHVLELARQKKRLLTGHIEYKVPQHMLVSKPSTVVVRIHGFEDKILHVLQDRTGSGELTVSEKMKVVLTAPDNPDEFTFPPKSDETKIIPVDAYQEWTWEVTPKHKATQQKLQIQVYLVYQNAKGTDEEILDEPVYPVDVDVEAISKTVKQKFQEDPIAWLKELLPEGKIYKALAGIFTTLGIGAWIKKRLDKGSTEKSKSNAGTPAEPET